MGWGGLRTDSGRLALEKVCGRNGAKSRAEREVVINGVPHRIEDKPFWRLFEILSIRVATKPHFENSNYCTWQYICLALGSTVGVLTICWWTPCFLSCSRRATADNAVRPLNPRAHLSLTS